MTKRKTKPKAAQADDVGDLVLVRNIAVKRSFFDHECRECKPGGEVRIPALMIDALMDAGMIEKVENEQS
jgi:hypothetical protein